MADHEVELGLSGSIAALSSGVSDNNLALDALQGSIATIDGNESHNNLALDALQGSIAELELNPPTRANESMQAGFSIEGIDWVEITTIEYEADEESMQAGFSIEGIEWENMFPDKGRKRDRNRMFGLMG